MLAGWQKRRSRITHRYTNTRSVQSKTIVKLLIPVKSLGTGKTLCLLCSSLAWLMIKKAQIQMQVQSMGALDQLSSGTYYVEQFSKNLNKGGGKTMVTPNPSTFGWSMPKIIYASRTHSQLSQAMQELKRSSYKHVSVTVLGSRDQLCINPEVAKEPNSATKIHMCQAKLKARNCFYYNNIETRWERHCLWF